jgi:50S ribosomal protein L16 3-hydroxylase
MDVFGGELSVERFFAEYWRRKPLFLEGGAESFLGRRWTNEDFDAAREALRTAESRAVVNERADDVTFIERVSAIEDDLAQRMRGLGELFGTPEPWCDTIRTYRPSGIGAHYDHSDNFVLQQDGIKHWHLAPPSYVARSDYARRMMGHLGVGHQELPDQDVVEFVLEPGDLTYIPLMWLHSGVSQEHSLSLSVVCPAVTLYSAVVPVVARLLYERATGHQTVEAIPTWLDEGARAAAAARVRRATHALLNHLTDDALVAEIERYQATLLPGLRHRPDGR